MKPLNEQTIKRLQKVANISEIRIADPNAVRLYVEWYGEPLMEPLYRDEAYESKLIDADNIDVTLFFENGVAVLHIPISWPDEYTDISIMERLLKLLKFAKKRKYPIEIDAVGEGYRCLIPIKNLYVNNRPVEIREPLNEQTIKRLQKLAGIEEIKVNKPSINNPQLKTLIEELHIKDYSRPVDGDVEILIGYVFDVIYNEHGLDGRHVNDVEKFIINPNDIKEKILEVEGYPELSEFTSQWLQKLEQIPDGAITIFNPDKYVSCKYIKQNNNLIGLAPSHHKNGLPSMKWDQAGRLVPNDGKYISIPIPNNNMNMNMLRPLNVDIHDLF